MLAEDTNNGGMSYMDCGCYLSRHINRALLTRSTDLQFIHRLVANSVSLDASGNFAGSVHMLTPHCYSFFQLKSGAAIDLLLGMKKVQW
jgi:hypothetical protein